MNRARFLVSVLCFAGTTGVAHAQHLHSVPHTSTHTHVERHGGHLHQTPHTTTHYDTVVHPSRGHHHDVPYVYNDYSYSTPLVRPSTIVTRPSVINSIPSSPEVIYSNNTVVSRKPAANAIPYRGPGVKIILPESEDAEVSFTIDDKEESTISSGEEQLLSRKGTYVVSFSRGESDEGEDYGIARYTIREGTYRFAVTHRGWELFREKDVESASISKVKKNRLPRPQEAPDSDNTGSLSE